MKLDQVFDNKYRPKRLHRAHCKHIGAGGNGTVTRKATPTELATLPKCLNCAYQAAKP